MRARHRVWLMLTLLLAAPIAALLLMPRPDDSLERVRAAGVLRVGYSIDAPFAMIGPGGRVTGESPETARQIAERLGVPRIEWVQTPFQALIPDLLDRRLDLIAAGLFITSERAARVRFSDPTIRAAPGVLVRRGNPRGLTPFQSLAHGRGYRLAVMAGSVEEARLRERGFTQEELMIIPDAQAGRAAVAQGVADGLVLSVPTLRWIAHSAPQTYEVLTLGVEHDADFVAFAFHPEDVELHAEWNRVQASFIGSRAHLQTIQPFGFVAQDLAGDVRTSEVLQR